ncbi:MAG TPA: acyl-CoA carboxylase subunit epsilon [Nocardioidaceae bacterium]|nr:acyl-CoA carboxylase subunit epsilon [Nocardioidaceae bacterium]
MTGTVGSGREGAPHLRVVRGDPSPEELAALVVVLSASASAPTLEPEPSRSPWSAPSRRLRGPLRAPAPDRDGWRSSALPR